MRAGPAGECGVAGSAHARAPVIGPSLRPLLSSSPPPSLARTSPSTTLNSPLSIYNMADRLAQVAGHLSNNYGRGLLAGEVAIITGTCRVALLGAAPNRR